MKKSLLVLDIDGTMYPKDVIGVMSSYGKETLKAANIVFDSTEEIQYPENQSIFD
jgi:hypothetical protein